MLDEQWLNCIRRVLLEGRHKIERSPFPSSEQLKQSVTLNEIKIFKKKSIIYRDYGLIRFHKDDVVTNTFIYILLH